MSRHLKISVAIKSLTGSRKVITMLNRITNAQIEELETEMTYICSKSNKITAVISNEKSASTGLVFGNYDGFTKTLLGKDTLHDNVEKTYQTVLGKPFLLRNSSL